MYPAAPLEAMSDLPLSHTSQRPFQKTHLKFLIFFVESAKNTFIINSGYFYQANPKPDRERLLQWVNQITSDELKIILPPCPERYENPANENVFPVAALQFIEPHDKSRLMLSAERRAQPLE